MSSLFSKASFVNHSHGLCSQTLNSLGADSFPNIPALSALTDPTWELPPALTSHSSSLIPCQGWRSLQGPCRERCSQQLPFPALNHKLSADSLFSFYDLWNSSFSAQKKKKKSPTSVQGNVLGSSASQGCVHITTHRTVLQLQLWWQEREISHKLELCL